MEERGIVAEVDGCEEVMDEKSGVTVMKVL